MRFRNTTNVPDDLLREVIRFVCPSTVSNYSIWFKRAGGGKRVFFAGRAYLGQMKVSIRIPKWEKLDKPYTGAKEGNGRGYIPWVSRTFEESLVAITAHELRHLAQHLNPTLYKRTPYARSQYSEVDCDTYANTMILKWREVYGAETKAPNPRAARTGPKPLTPRQRLRAMADSCGVELEFGSPSADCIYVAPPSTLCDEDGDMPDDPYADEHYHYEYETAKRAIETYAALVKAKETSELSRVDTLVDTISLDAAAKPASLIE